MQVSLAACVAMMLAAGLLLWLNLRQRTEHIADVIVLPVYGFPASCACGDAYVPGFDGSLYEWSGPATPSVSDDGQQKKILIKRGDSLIMFASQRKVDAYRVLERQVELRAWWRLPANALANLGILFAVGFAVEFLLRRRERTPARGEGTAN